MERLSKRAGDEFMAEVQEAVDDGVQWVALAKAIQGRDDAYLFVKADMLSRHYKAKDCKCWSNGQPV